MEAGSGQAGGVRKQGWGPVFSAFAAEEDGGDGGGAGGQVCGGVLLAMWLLWQQQLQQ